MKVAAVQHDVVWEDAAATHTHVAQMVADSAAAGARLVVLTEMYSTGFSMATERILRICGASAVRTVSIRRSAATASGARSMMRTIRARRASSMRFPPVNRCMAD